MDECSCRRDDWAEQLDETLETDYRFSDSLDATAGERGSLLSCLVTMPQSKMIGTGVDPG